MHTNMCTRILWMTSTGTSGRHTQASRLHNITSGCEQLTSDVVDTATVAMAVSMQAPRQPVTRQDRQTAMLVFETAMRLLCVLYLWSKWP